MNNFPDLDLSPLIKTEIALAALHGVGRIEDLAAKYGVTPAQVLSWKNRAASACLSAFSDQLSDSESTEEDKGHLSFVAKTRKQLQDSLSVNAVGLWHWDVVQNRIVGDAKFGELFGFQVTPCGAPVDVYLSCIHPEDATRVSNAIATALKTGTLFDEEFRILLPEGSSRWIQGRGVVKKDELNRAVGLQGLTMDISSKKSAEAKLQESEERYRRLLESLDEGFCVIEILFDDNRTPIDYRFIEANSAFQRQTGLVSPVGKRIRELVPNLDSAWLTRYGKVALTGVADQFEQYASGLGRWFYVNALRFDSAQSNRVAVLFTDISNRKRAESALRESETKAREAAWHAEEKRGQLDALLDAALVGIALADAQGKVVRVNPASEKLWGPAPSINSVEDYHLWKGWWADGSDRQGLCVAANEWALARALRGEEVRDDIVEIEPFNNPRGRRTILSSGAPALDKDGKIVGAIVTQLDITARVRAEATARESVERFRTLADNIPQLAWMADADGRRTWYNSRWHTYTGTTPEEMQRRDWREFHHPDHVERIDRIYYGHMYEGAAWEVTFPFRRYDGIYRWFLTRAVPLYDESGKITQWFGTSTDVTAQREAEEALRLADRRKDEYIAVLAHELRNPLTPIRTGIDILGNCETCTPLIKRVLDGMDRQVTHMSRLIEELLDVARISRGKVELRLEDCDIVQIVRLTMRDYQPNFDESGVLLQASLPNDSVWVRGDKLRLVQIVGNLLHNATKFTPAGGTVTLEVAVVRNEGADAVAITVTDTGCGLSQELLPLLFNAFIQGQQDLSRSKGGLGLGLTLVKGLVDMHGGTVTASSPGHNKGAVFTVHLPVLSHLPTLALREVDVAPAGPMSIVVIDDNLEVLESLEIALSLLGHKVTTARNGYTGVELVCKERPDLVLCDIGLPDGVSGYDVARTLRSDPKTASIPLVALSGYSQERDRQLSKEAGFDHHLAKPASQRDLALVLATAEKHKLSTLKDAPLMAD